MNIFNDFQSRVVAAIIERLARGRAAQPASTRRTWWSSRRATPRTAISRRTPRWCWPRKPANPRAFADLLAARWLRSRTSCRSRWRGPASSTSACRRVFQQVVAACLREGLAFGRARAAEPVPTNVEYVSANPTGPMHVGHGRGAVFGDALANLLAFAGRSVTREYYINDAGAQVDVLARSAFLRYREALGEDDRGSPRGSTPATI